MNLTIQPLTPFLWPALEALFGKGGASNGCWCMYWRIGAEYHKRPREKNRIAFRRIVKHGPPQNREARSATGVGGFRWGEGRGLVPAHTATGLELAQS
jgi:hypothetical protein